MTFSSVTALCLLLFSSAHAANKKPSKKTNLTPKAESIARADKDTLKLVEHVVKTETADLDYALVPPFMSLDPKSLPKDLRAVYQAKRAELNALRKISENKRKPPIRRAVEPKEPACAPEEGDAAYVRALRGMGFEEIDETELDYLSKKTKCSECELHEESSLMSVVIPAKKKKDRATRHLFLSQSDPWMAIVLRFRSGGRGGTDFFGAFHGACH